MCSLCWHRPSARVWQVRIVTPGSATELREQATAIVDELHPTQNPSINSALVAALADLMVVHAGRTADAGSYKYDYADLADVVKLTRPVLAAHGLVALTPVHDHGTGLACTVVILHVSGDRIDFGPLPFQHGRDAQATGSAITYHRRYALAAALGLAVGDDDDGAAAVQRPAQPEFVWNEAAVKADLLNLVEQDKAKAKRVWDESDTDGIEPGPGVAARLLEAWENQPADGEAVPA